MRYLLRAPRGEGRALARAVLHAIACLLSGDVLGVREAYVSTAANIRQRKLSTFERLSPDDFAAATAAPEQPSLFERSLADARSEPVF